MSPPLSPEAAAVLDTFVEAYPEYLRTRVPGVTAEEFDDAVARGRVWLEKELGALLSKDFTRQRRGPLELFQEAMCFPTEALEALGEAPPERSDVERAALPGDRYRLAPASSQELGEAAWRAHVAWGIAKAEAVAGAVPAPATRGAPSVAIVGGTPQQRALIEGAARRSGLKVALWRNPAAIQRGLEAGPPVLAVIQLDHAAAHEAISSIAAAGGRVLAYGDGVDDLQVAAMMALGAAAVFDTDRLQVGLERMLPTGV